MPQTDLPIISLFCGAGGLDLGFRQERYRVLLACDNHPAAVASYNVNTRPKVARLTDLSETTGDRLLDLVGKVAPGQLPIGIVGGPPCQGFSRGNVHTSPDDPRNALPFKYAEILASMNRKCRLSFFVFENVMGLLSERHKVRFQQISDAFRSAGFNIFTQALCANSFGVPQRRRRLFVVGLNSETMPNLVFTFPEGDRQRKTVRDAIADLPAPAYFTRGLDGKTIPYHPNHWTMQPKSRKFTSGDSTDGRSFRRLSWDEESPTVAYGNREIHLHPNGNRRLSVHEAMLLQGFPPKYRLQGNFSQQVTQVSNAVPPPVARFIARAIRRLLSQDRASVRVSASLG